MFTKTNNATIITSSSGQYSLKNNEVLTFLLFFYLVFCGQEKESFWRTILRDIFGKYQVMNHQVVIICNCETFKLVGGFRLP